MKNWQDFLDSLSTKGGNIITAGIIMGALAIGMNHVHSTDSFAVVRDLLVGFGGALLAMLKGDSSRQQMNDRRDSVIAPPIIVPPVPPVPTSPASAPSSNF